VNTALPEGLPFEMVIPLCKAIEETQPDGSFILGGVCSDPSLDLQRERVVNSPKAMAFTLDFLPRWGKVNWIHGAHNIGDVLEARLISAEEVAQQFGKQIEGDQGTFVKSRIYPIVPEAPQDLRDAHYHIQAGARLGWSLQGRAVRDLTKGVVTASLANKVALCPQPVNMNSFATVLAKSLSDMVEVLDGTTQADVLAQAGAENPGFVISYPELAGTDRIGTLPAGIPSPGPWQVTLSQSVLTRIIQKAIMGATGSGGESGMDAAQYEGGRALGRESLEGKAYCEHCRRNHRGQAGDKCPDCGEPLQDITTKIAKSLEFLQALRGDV